MKLPDLKLLVQEQAFFVKFEDGRMWYRISCCWEDCAFGGKFEFPIDVRNHDAGGVFNSSEKGNYVDALDSEAIAVR